MFSGETETEVINKIITKNAPMSWEEIVEMNINEWMYSEKREMMLTGARYYLGRTDIQKKHVDSAGREIKSRSNIKLEHGFTKKLVDQKVGYIFGKIPSIIFHGNELENGSEFEKEAEKDSEFRKLVRDTFDRHFWRTITRLAKESINKGIAWLQVYFDDGKMKFAKLNSEEVIPIWKNGTHTELEAAIRVYSADCYAGKNKTAETKAEVYTSDGVYFYDYKSRGMSNGKLNFKKASPHFTINGSGKNWARIPLIPFKYNEEEQPLVDQIKSIVDNYNLQASINADLLADLPVFIYKLINYGGQNLEEFLRDLQEYRVVTLDESGDVGKLQAEPNAGVYQLLEYSRKDIYEFGRGVDSQTENFGTSSGVALKFRYADLDMDCNILESEFQAGFEDIFWFMRQYAMILGMKADDKADVVFNRDILISESEVIKDCVNSMGIISGETIIANHPWVTDADAEIAKMGSVKGGDANE